jgi:hypothetical protein
VAARLEERDLLRVHGDDYVEYRARTRRMQKCYLEPTLRRHDGGYA